MPVRVTTVAPGILRIAIGDRPPGAASSYLPQPPPTGADPGPVAAIPEGDALVFTIAGRRLLRLDLASITLTPTLRLRFEFLGEQHFYGLGEGGPQFDRLGATRRLWNFQSNRGHGADIAIPLLLSQAGYALFFDNSAAARIEPADVYEGAWFDYTSEPGSLDLYVIGGADLRAVMGGVAGLLGHAAMPPRWALGYMQSSRHFDSPGEVRSLAHTIREKRIPCDVLIFLSTYGTERGLNRIVGDLRFQHDLFPDPAATLKEFHAANFRVLSHEYPVLHPAAPGFAEAERRGYLLDYAYPDQPVQPGVATYKQGQRFLDFSRPEVRHWWWAQHADLLATGIDGWWLDGGEGPPAATALHAGPGTVLHNRFDLLRQQAFAEGEHADRPDRRPFLLTRSGGPGMQRFGAMPWSGDINTSFATFEAQVKIGLNLALSGVPHWGTDIGGFYSVAPDAGELFVRWLQFGAFCSIFRAHGHVWRRHLPWAHGPEIEAICRRTIELRYRLMPYTYTLAWQAHRHGLPMMRPLVLNHPDDPSVWDLGTEYLWGDDLLVAPVTRAGATHWPVYLPAGAWHDFWTNEIHRGPCAVTVAAPLDRLPLFVRGGSIIPLGPVVQHDGEQPLAELTLLDHPEGESSFTLYEDDGLTQRHRDGAFAETEITCAEDAAWLTCRIAAPAGDASVIPPGRRYTLRIRTDRTPRAVTRDGAAHSGWRRDGAFLVVADLAQPAEVRITW